jgi:hypothetical protein
MAGVAGVAVVAVVAVVEANRTLLQVYITCLVRSEAGRTLIVKELLQWSWKLFKAPLIPLMLQKPEILFRLRDLLTNKKESRASRSVGE